VSESVAVVSNAGPLMVLAKLNLLYLLKALYGRVRIAESVYNEVVTDGIRQGYEDARTLFLFLNQMRWKPESVAATSLDWLPPHLDRGERDTLALADKFSKSLVLMDELLGRQAARERGLGVRGSLGILIEAYRNQLIDGEQLRLYFNEITRRQDIWIDPALAERLLREVLES
jgi:predicted nucleic acid-binding protein